MFQKDAKAMGLPSILLTSTYCVPKLIYLLSDANFMKWPTYNQLYQ